MISVGSGGKQSSTQNQRTESNRRVAETVTGIQPYQREFAQKQGQLWNMLQGRIAQPVELQRAEAFSSTPDAITQNLVSQGLQNIKGQQQAGARGTASALSTAGSGNNQALLAALNRQSGVASAGASNQLFAEAMKAQRDQDIARQNIIAQQNRDVLAGRAQGVSELAPGLQMLQGITDMARTSAGRNISESGTSTSTGRTVAKRGK